MAAGSGIRVGDVIGDRYRIVAVVGHGGMATVYRARDEALGRDVALKVVRAGAEQATGTTIQGEIDVLATLNHHSLVTLFDAGVTHDDDDGDVPYFVMEFVLGETLADRVAAGPVNEVDAARMAGDLAEGLHVAHANGIVHRDVKPANVLLSPSMLPEREFSAKLADFGIAHLASAPRETRPGTFVGTVAYISPEQAQGADPAPPADVYSLGLVLLEAMTGRRAFPGTTGESLVARVAADPKIPGSLSPEWRAMVRAMTSRRPDDRPTAAEVAGLARRLELLAAQARDRGMPAVGRAAPAAVVAVETGAGDVPTGAGDVPTDVGQAPTGANEAPVGADAGQTGAVPLPTGAHRSPTAVLPVVDARHGGVVTSRPAARRRARAVLAVAASSALVVGLVGAVVSSLDEGTGEAGSGVAVELDGAPGDAPVVGSLVPAGDLELTEAEDVVTAPAEEPGSAEPTAEPTTAAPAPTKPVKNPNAGPSERGKVKGQGAGKDKPGKGSDKPGKGADKPGKGKGR